MKLKFQQYQYLYEQELTAFELETFKINSSYQMCRLNMFMYFVKKLSIPPYK
jgi:hypothetical protein